MNTITDNGNGVIYIETECGKTFGLVNAFKVIDEDGLTFPEGISVLESYFDIDQAFYSEAAVVVNVDNKKIVLTRYIAEVLTRTSNKQKALEGIINGIRKINELRQNEEAIGNDSTDEELVTIYHDIGDLYDLDIKDTEECLTELFGYDGYCAIREAEHGNY